MYPDVINELEKNSFNEHNVPTGHLITRISKGFSEDIFFEDGKIHFYNDNNPKQHEYTKAEFRLLLKYFDSVWKGN